MRSWLMPKCKFSKSLLHKKLLPCTQLFVNVVSIIDVLITYFFCNFMKIDIEVELMHINWFEQINNKFHIDRFL